MEKVKLGKVVKLHGILGQMKINTQLDKDFDIKKIKELFDEEGNDFKVTRIFKTSDAVVVSLDGIDLEKARTYIGKEFYVSREIVSGKILIEDLKGSDVFLENNKLVGKIVDVQDYGSAEVFFLTKPNGTEFMFPNVKDLIISFDYITKKLIVSESRLKEVSDYED